METTQLSEELQAIILSYQDSPIQVADEQIEFWIRQNKVDRAYSKKQFQELVDLTDKLKYKFSEFLKFKKYDHLDDEIKYLTEKIQIKVTEHRQDSKKHIRNAYLNLETIFTSMYKIMTLIHNLKSCDAVSSYDVIFELGQLTSTFDYVTGLKVSKKEHANSGAIAKAQKIAQFNNAVKKFIETDGETFKNYEDTFNYLVRKAVSLNDYLKKVSLNYSAEYFKEKDFIRLKSPVQTTEIYHPKIDTNSHGKLKKFFDKP